MVLIKPYTQGDIQSSIDVWLNYEYVSVLRDSPLNNLWHPSAHQKLTSYPTLRRKCLLQVVNKEKDKGSWYIATTFFLRSKLILLIKFSAKFVRWMKYQKQLSRGALYKRACNFIKKETPEKVFFCEFWKISKNTSLDRISLVAAFRLP